MAPGSTMINIAAPDGRLRVALTSATAAMAAIAAQFRCADHANAHHGGGLTISPDERARRKRREKIAKASRRRNRR